MKNNKNLLTIGLLIVIVILVGLLVGKGGSNQVADDQSAAAHNGGGGGGTATVYCSDSDNGINQAIQGTAQTYTLKSNGAHTIVATSTDSCINASSLTEYSCNTNSIATTPISCNTSGGCVNGACVGAPLVDTTAPTVMLKHPTEGYAFCPSNGYFSDTIADNVFPFPTTGVTFYVDGVAFNPGPVTFYSPNEYGMSVPGANLPAPGTHTVYSKACDAAGNCATTPSVNFTVASYCTS